MALSPLSAPSLTNFRALSFDVFGTLVDEPKMLVAALEPLIPQLPPEYEAKTSATAQYAAFCRHEKAFQAKRPFIAYEDTLAAACHSLAEEWNVKANDKDARAVATALCKSPPFPDTIEALHILSKYYTLIALSNNSEKGIEAVMAGPLKEVKFDLILLAERIGAYKPDLKNFEYLLNELEKQGIRKDQVLKVAQGVGSDHVPAKMLGLYSAWISRGRPDSERGYDGIGEEYVGEVEFAWRWNSVGEMARDVQAAYEAASY